MACISIVLKKAKQNLENVTLQSEMRYQLLQDELTHIFAFNIFLK